MDPIGNALKYRSCPISTFFLKQHFHRIESLTLNGTSILQPIPSSRALRILSIQPHAMFDFITYIFLQLKLILLSLLRQPQKASPPSLLYKLPPEVRMKIYPHALALNYNNQPPALLLTLAKEPILYAEARSLYLKINARVDQSTEKPSKPDLPSNYSRSGTSC
jgi:hypothetical protein